MSGGDWTPERIAVLIALWNEDLPTSEIGRRLGITKNAVIGKVHRLGLPKRRMAPEKPQDAQVIRLSELRTGMCSWPVGNPGEESFHFCGAQTVTGKPYCGHHCDVAYVRAGKDRSKTSVA
jgi:GcrA cell cycle regulator